MREGSRAIVNRDEDGRMDRGVLFVTIDLSEGKLKVRAERHATDEMSVRVRSRCATLGNRRGVWQTTVFRRFERSESRVKEEVEVRKDRESRL